MINCLMRWIRSILFQFIFYGWTLILCVVFIPTLFLGRRAAYLMPYCWTKSVPFILKWVCGIKIEIRGLENLPKQNGYIIASKHQRHWKRWCFIQLFPRYFVC